MALSKVIIVQNLKDLNSVEKKEKKFSNEETCQWSPLNMSKNKKWWYIHDLLDVIYNPTKFQLNQMRKKVR